jgi:hypothetical protein
MGNTRNACRVLVGSDDAKRPLERSTLRWEDSIKTDLPEVGWGSMDWVHLSQDRDSGGLLRLR